MAQTIDLRFESSSSHGYVGVLDDSTLTTGRIASQNAGSTNAGIYYQVGGGGLNGFFSAALGTLLAPVNRTLATAYDQRFGDGAWSADSAVTRTDRLTSLYVAIPRPIPSGARIGDRVAGMVYSVGPVLGGRIVDRDAYRQIYVDALSAVAAENRGATERIEALRITMLSTGIYGGTSTAAEATDLARDVAVLILDALEVAMSSPTASDLPGLILVNTKGSDARSSKEIDAFNFAAAARGISVDAIGFSLAAPP